MFTNKKKNNTLTFFSISKLPVFQGSDTDKLNIKAPKEDLLKEGEESIPFKIESTAVSNVKERVFIP